MIERIGAVPGIRSVALTRTLLLSGSTSSSSVWVEGRASEKANESDMYVMTVSPAFFSTMEIPLLTGRTFNDHDVKTSPKVAVINESAAKELFPGESPLGHHIGFSMEKAGDVEIIGVTRDTKYSSIRESAPPTMYSSSLQGVTTAMAFVARTAVDPNTLSERVRAAVREIDPNLPIASFTTQADQLEGRFAQERLFATAYSLFGGLALLLACIGLFGLMSYNVSRRTNEIGIRMALGAQRLNVVVMILGESMLLVGLGVVVGLGSSFAAGRLVKTVLFGLAPNDIVTIVSAIVLVLLVSVLAGYLPARRASRVDPMVALHEA
jgi:predicted permease